MSVLELQAPPPPKPAARAPRPRRVRRRTSLQAHGEPMIWLTGGAMVVSLAMILGLLLLVVWQGLPTFWPQPVVALETTSGHVMGEVSEAQRFVPDETYRAGLSSEEATRLERLLARGDGTLSRRQVRIGNYELTGEHYRWVDEVEELSASLPDWALVIERLDWGRFYGVPEALLVDGEAVAEDPVVIWERLVPLQEESRARYLRRRAIEREEIGSANHREEAARLAMRRAELDHGEDSAAWREARQAFEQTSAEVEREIRELQVETGRLREENERYALLLSTANGKEKRMAVEEIVRVYPANQLDTVGRWGVFLSRWWEFLSDAPRYQNSEGGVAPAIFGTVLMTLLMSFLVVPFGVLAALYLREYAKQGALISAIRIAVNNLAGVPSIVFGVFGLGFFCYVIGGRIDEVLFYERLPNPTLGTGGLMWASFTLALLTLPVVIVSTEEALAAVPGSMREGSYACGATKWQTMRRIVLPRAAPGIMTGMILAIARGAGEVAPLMLVGVLKIAPEPLIDGTAPFIHPERSFMHLGFHIYDLGFQSPNSEAAIPMVFTTTLLLISVIVLLNVMAIWIRSRLRRRFHVLHT